MLVVKGYNQSFGLVAKNVTVRLLLTLTSVKEWHLHQLDVNNTFLHGFLDEEVYIQVPEGYSKAQPGQIARSTSGIVLTQTKYATDIVKDLKIEECFGVVTPLPVDWQAHDLNSSILKNSSNDSSLMLQAYCDADWTRCKTTRRSISGYCIILGTSLVAWKSKKQNIIFKSSAEAEYRSLAYTACELKWQNYIFKDLHIPLPQPIQVWCDNQSVIHITENSVFHERTKHEIDCHLVRYYYKQGFIKPVHVCTKLQLADVFTKSLSTNVLFPLLFKMSFRSTTAS
ncbi:transmembrane signal receptor [Lithospermum erythrorhizon]|uniref:Transmembrane signal receptor n=1 Tax=Lithospermum erythrorhizon TaxID=34254 RepID=A0AAV3PAQ6_LITER